MSDEKKKEGYLLVSVDDDDVEEVEEKLKKAGLTIIDRAVRAKEPVEESTPQKQLLLD